MKSLALQTKGYRLLEKGYQDWLRNLGYNRQMVRAFPLQAREFLHWLEGEGIVEIKLVDQKVAERFMEYFRSRSNLRLGGGLSHAHINKQTYCLNLLFKYLRLTGEIVDPIELNYLSKKSVRTKEVLSEAEVKLLYASCGMDVLGQRDRAMLSVYYGCGLRRSEGLRLEVEDVLFERSLLHVREGKNGWDRYVPMAVGVKEDLERYIYGARQLLSSQSSSRRLFLSDKGKDISDVTLVRRLKNLLDKSGLRESISLHSLRHSIATHLLSGGMSLEEVSAFLGHRALDSTQSYTHVKTRTWKKD